MKTLRLTMLAALVFAAAPTFSEATVPHFGLSRSAPEADATVASPAEVRLWFTQEPQEGTTQIRLIDADGDAIATGDVAQDPEDAQSFAVAVDHPLPSGSYTVSWRGMGADGHVVRDTFTFSVSSH